MRIIIPIGGSIGVSDLGMIGLKFHEPDRSYLVALTVDEALTLSRQLKDVAGAEQMAQALGTTTFDRLARGNTQFKGPNHGDPRLQGGGDSPQ